jgi:hypothetical protein
MRFEIFIQGKKWKPGGRKETRRMGREKIDEVWINDILLFWALSCFLGLELFYDLKISL